MKKVKVAMSGGGGGVWRVKIGDRTVTGGAIDVAEGSHVIKWFITAGQPGAKYTLEVTAPPSAKLKIEGKLVSTGKTSGSENIEVA